MAGFVMCAACQAEYDDPRDRRFHAQPNACPDCGPHVSGYEAAVAGAARRRDRGGQGRRRLPPRVPRRRRGGRRAAARPQAPRGPAVRADGARPRPRRTRRPGHVRDLPRASQRQRPRSVLADRLARPARTRVAASVAPRSRELGVMLPYSPLHHLLLADVGVPLVMTSGNVSDEPIAFTRRGRAGAAGRDRGRVPHCTTARSTRAPTTRACAAGGSCAARAGTCRRRCRSPPRRRCWRSAPSSRRRSRSPATAARGSATTSATCATTRPCAPSPTAIAHFERLFAVTPELVAHDLHPEYLSTKYALDLDLPRVAVQHHHAHLAACLAEHGVEPARGRDLRRHRLRQRRHGLGRRAPARRPRRRSSASATSGPSGCPAARPRSASRGGWPARGWLEIGLDACRHRELGAGRPRSPAPASPRR